RPHPDELKNHHDAEEQEYVTRCERSDRFGEESSDQGRKNPMCKTAQRLPLRAMAIGKYFGNQYPHDRTLPDRMCRNESEDTHWHNCKMPGKKRPGDKPQRNDVAQRTHVEQRSPAHPIDEPQTCKGKYEIGNANADRLEQCSLLTQAGHFKNTRSEIQDCV